MEQRGTDCGNPVPPLAAAVSEVILIGRVGGMWRAPSWASGQEGRDGGSGAEQGEEDEDETTDEGDQEYHRDQYGPDRRGQSIARSVAANGEHDPAPQKVRGYEHAEEKKHQVDGQ